MASSLTLRDLTDAIRSSAALRARVRLQPAGGAGTRVLPPTFAGAVYQIEHRILPDRDAPVPCVVLDTVQSQANRFEEALLQAWRAGRISIPVVSSDFGNADLIDPIGEVTSLEAPHRIADAIFRDSLLDGSRFRESERGRALDHASSSNATPLFELCPTALTFGIWDSTGPKGGLGVKFERALSSEIMGIGMPDLELLREQRRRGLRRDPLGIREAVRVKGRRDDWAVVPGGETKGTLKPSEINHSNVPFETENSGVTIEYAEQVVVLSLIALRRLRFPLNDSQPVTGTDEAARTALAALALCGVTLASERGWDLRSGCVLFPDQSMEWELLDTPGETPKRFTLAGDEAVDLLEAAGSASAKAGLEWNSAPLVLRPSDQLVELVRRSQEATAAGASEA